MLLTGSVAFLVHFLREKESIESGTGLLGPWGKQMRREIMGRRRWGKRGIGLD